MGKLGSLRATQKELRKSFEARKKAEWADITSELEARISAEINRMHKAGVKTSVIMREYGTSDYRTVRDRIVDASTTTVLETLTGLTWTHVKDFTWDVTDGTQSATVVVLEDEGVVMLTKTTDPGFGEQVNMEAGYQLWQDRNSGS